MHGTITNISATTDLQVKLNWIATGEDWDLGDVINGEWTIAYSSSQVTNPDLAQNTTSYVASWVTGSLQSKAIMGLKIGTTY